MNYLIAMLSFVVYYITTILDNDISPDTKVIASGIALGFMCIMYYLNEISDIMREKQ